VRRVGIEERRARLGLRHRLAGTALTTAPEEAARAVVALHATDPASVFLSVRARTAQVGVEAIEDALYEQRSLVRMLGMRRTVFVVPVELAPVIQAGCAAPIAALQRRRYIRVLEDAGVGDAAWLKEVEESTAVALAARGEATGAQLSADEPRLRTRVLLAEGKPYAAPANITTWVLFMLAADGRIVRGRPLGSWTSTQYRWSPVETWLPGGMAKMPPERARVHLVRRWLAAFGPGTVADLRWWTGWTAALVRQALTAIGPVEVDLGGETGLVLADDVDPVVRPEPWVALLPALDPTAMGWSARSWYLGEHAAALFDRSGNIGPTVWLDGRIVGGWAQRTSGEVVFRLLEDVGSEATTKIAQAAAAVSAWIGPARITPRFRTPLERDLSA
jgi:Winged helix DNA-binding domain